MGVRSLRRLVLVYLRWCCHTYCPHHERGDERRRTQRGQGRLRPGERDADGADEHVESFGVWAAAAHTGARLVPVVARLGALASTSTSTCNDEEEVAQLRAEVGRLQRRVVQLETEKKSQQRRAVVAEREQLATTQVCIKRDGDGATENWTLDAYELYDATARTWRSARSARRPTSAS